MDNRDKQDPGVAIDVGDLADARRGVLKAGSSLIKPKSLGKKST